MTVDVSRSHRHNPRWWLIFRAVAAAAEKVVFQSFAPSTAHHCEVIPKRGRIDDMVGFSTAEHRRSAVFVSYHLHTVFGSSFTLTVPSAAGSPIGYDHIVSLRVSNEDPGR